MLILNRAIYKLWRTICLAIMETKYNHFLGYILAAGSICSCGNIQTQETNLERSGKGKTLKPKKQKAGRRRRHAPAIPTNRRNFQNYQRNTPPPPTQTNPVQDDTLALHAEVDQFISDVLNCSPNRDTWADIVNRILQNPALENYLKAKLTPPNGAQFLVAAIKNGCVELLQYLIENKTKFNLDINATDTNGGNFLWHAVNLEQESCVPLLIAAGVDMFQCDAQGINPFILSARKGNLNIFKSFVKDNNVPVKYGVATYGRIAVEEAMKNDQWKFIDYLQKNPFDMEILQVFINWINIYIQDPTYKLCFDTQSRVLTDVKEINVGSTLRHRLLIIAAQSGNFKFISSAINEWEGIEDMASEMVNAAIEKEMYDVVGALVFIFRNKVYNEVPFDDYLFGRIAFQTRSTFPKRINNDQQKKEWLNTKFSLLLTTTQTLRLGSVDKVFKQAWFVAAQYGNLHAIEILLEMYPDFLDLQNEVGETAVYMSAERGKEEVLEFLLNKGANVVLKNTVRENSLLHAAAQHGKLNTVQVLLNSPHKDVLINVVNNMNQTALHIATWRAAKNAPNNGLYVEIIHALLDNGADHTIRDNKGQNIFYIACKVGNLDFAKKLHEMLQAHVKDTAELNEFLLAKIEMFDEEGKPGGFNGWTTLTVAKSRKNQAIVDWLQSLEVTEIIKEDKPQESTQTDNEEIVGVKPKSQRRVKFSLPTLPTVRKQQQTQNTCTVTFPAEFYPLVTGQVSAYVSRTQAPPITTFPSMLYPNINSPISGQQQVNASQPQTTSSGLFTIWE